MKNRILRYIILSVLFIVYLREGNAQSIYLEKDGTMGHLSETQDQYDIVFLHSLKKYIPTTPTFDNVSITGSNCVPNGVYDDYAKSLAIDPSQALVTKGVDEVILDFYEGSRFAFPICISHTVFRIIDFGFKPDAVRTEYCLQSGDENLEFFVNFFANNSVILTFTGPGVVKSGGAYYFKPSVAGVGTHTITAKALFENGLATETIQFTVTEPVIDIGPDIPVCTGSEDFDLLGSPSGGTWSGTFVSGNKFMSSQATPGEYIVTYSVTENDCNKTGSKKIIVKESTSVTAGSDFNTCINASVISLAAKGSPAGGTWSGSGVSGSTYKPNAVGDFPLTYTYDNGQCFSSAIVTSHVFDLPTVSAGNDIKICLGETNVDLLADESPTGGIWDGPLVTGHYFNPQGNTAPGVYTINYTYKNEHECSSTDSKDITIKDFPIVEAGNDQTVCINNTDFNLDGFAPEGGIWSGTGFVGPFRWSPKLAGNGVHKLIYTYTKDGCAVSDFINITVQDISPLTIGSNKIFCSNEEVYNLNSDLDPTRLGGEWSGSNVSGINFNPNVNQGAYIITYKFANENGCITTKTKEFTVVNQPEVIAGPALQACLFSSPINLIGEYPKGGIWSGPGVTDSKFNPEEVGVGTHDITYTYSNHGCTNFAKRSITVTPPGEIDGGQNIVTCIAGDLIDLKETTNEKSGTWTGPGIDLNIFNPSIAGEGTHTLTLTVKDELGCINHATKIASVLPKITVDSGPDLKTCDNSGIINLEDGLDSPGGTWNGSGVSGKLFDPSSIGKGTFTITYRLESKFGCTATDTRIITVNIKPEVTAGPPAQTCLNAPAINLIGEYPIGGKWFGPGVFEDRFNPVTVGVGTHIITYQFTNEKGCVNTASKSVVVSAPSPIDAGQNIFTCVSGDLIDLKETTSQKTGTWTGPGVSSNIFNPLSAGEGTHSIILTVNEDLGCINRATKVITVLSKLTVDSGSDLKVCSNSGLINLDDGLTNPGGLWSGSGVTGNQFDPTIGQGSFTLSYTLAPKYGCIANDTRIIKVLSPGSASIGPDISICKEFPIIDLTLNSSPQGGAFIGAGVNNNKFDPMIAGIGQHTISYTVDDVSGCLITKTKIITVAELAPIDIGSDLDVCVKTNPIDLLKDVKMLGGSFDGDGLEGTIFKPQLAGIGVHTISYNHTSTQGCKSSGQRVISVKEPQEIFGGEDISLCKSVQTFDLTGHGLTPDGKYFGTGVSANIFNPSLAGIGSFAIRYVVDKGNGCISEDEIIIDVKESSISDFGQDTIVCIASQPIDLSVNSQLKNGLWEGDGVVTNIFYPSLAGLGSHNIDFSISTLECDIAGRRKITVTDLPLPATSDLTSALGCIGSFVGLKAKIDPKDRVNNVNVGWFREDSEIPFHLGESISFEIVGNEQIYYRAVNAFGCSSGQNDYIRIETDNPTGDYEVIEQVVDFGKPIQFLTKDIKNTKDFKWNFGDGLISYERDPYHYYYDSGPFNITLTLTSSTGCITTIKKENYLTVKTEPGRDTITTSNGRVIESVYPQVISYSPNPTSGVFDIMLQTTRGQYTIEAVDYMGKATTLGLYPIDESTENLHVDMSDLRAGLYLIVVRNENHLFKFKIIKQ